MGEQACAESRSDSATVADSSEGIEMRDAHEVVDRNPFVERVSAAGGRAVRDAGDFRQLPERVAVIAKGLGAEGDRLAVPRRGVRLLETRHERVAGVESKCVADRLKIDVDRRAGALRDL